VHPTDAPLVTVDVQPVPGAWRVLLTPMRASATADRLTARSRPDLPAPPVAATRFRNTGSRSLSGESVVEGASSRSSFAAAAVSAPPGPASAPPVAAPVASRPPPAEVMPKVALIVGEVPVGPMDRGLIDRMLRVMTEVGASDLHLVCDRPPMMRLHGEIAPLPGEHAVLRQPAMKSLLLSTMSDEARRVYASRNDVDFAYEIEGLARFRGNAFVDRRGCAGVFRRIPVDIVSAEVLGISKHVLDLCDLSKGLVLVTGPTGSGKSTTLAALVDRINATRRDHIITIEDPIEFVHKNNRCLVNQREVGVHTDGFKDALRAALREDPDVVLVGEMRDLETVAIAIETAETGHLVFGTLHTRTATNTVDRIIDQFPAERQPQIRTMLSESLKAVISQTLCKKIGGGRVAAHEVLFVSPAVANLIREGKSYQLYGVMQTSKQVGMQTLNDALGELVRSGRIDIREAWAKAINKQELRTLFQQQGIPLPRDLAAKDP
jgi:twitching motility protein PilT